MTKVKNALCLWAEYISRDIFQTVVITILITLLTFVFSDLCTDVQRYNAILNISNKLENRYFYQLGMYSDREECVKLLDTLRSSESIHDVVPINYFSGSGVDVYEDQWRSLFAVYNISDSSFDSSSVCSVALNDGTIIDSLEPNRVILSEKASESYSKGDTFDLWIEYISYEGGVHVEEASIPVTVEGFISEDDFVIYTGHHPKDLSGLYTTVRNPMHPIELMLIDGYPKYYCISSVFIDGSKTINFNYSSPQMLMIEPEAVASWQDVSDELTACGLNPGDAVSYETLKANYIENNHEEFRHLGIISVVAVLCMIEVLFGAFIDWYLHKRSELAITVFCGATWNESVLLSASPYLLSIFLGTVIGSTLWRLFEVVVKSELLLVTWKEQFLMFVAYVVIYALGVLIYSVCLKKLSPMDIYRIRE